MPHTSPSATLTAAATITATITALTLASAPKAQAQETRKASNCFALANGPANTPAHGPERIIPAALGPPVTTDQVRIHYINHAQFALQSGSVTAVTDYTGFIGNPDIVPDVATMNNAHATHWTDNPDPRIPHVLQGWPTGGTSARHDLDLGAMLVRNVPTDTRSRFGDGVQRDGNSIFVFEAGGLCIGHLGHLHQIPDDAQYAAIGRLDVVMVPVDGGYTMSTDAMIGVVDRLRARVIIPMHWFSGASLDTFLATLGGKYPVVKTGGPDLVLSQDTLPAAASILVLDPAPL